MTGNARRRLIVGGVAVGVLVLLLLGAALLVRIGRPQSGSNDQAMPTTTGSDEAAREAVPTGGREGRTAMTQDEPGAVAAAIAYAAAPQEWLYLFDDEIAAAVTAAATPAEAERLATEVVDEIGLARDSLLESPGPVWWIVRPLAWRVESFAGTRTTVSVWTVSILSAADVAMPQADWTTSMFDLEWIDGAWRVAGTEDVPGPTPAGGLTDVPWEPEPFAAALEGFTRIDGEPLR